MIQKAIDIINRIVNDVEPGEIITGKVVRIMNFGAFVELAPNKDGLVHISKLSNKRVAKVEDVVNIAIPSPSRCWRSTAWAVST